VAIVDGSHGEAELRALHEGAVRGVRFNFVRHLGGTPDMDLFQRTTDRIRELGWHVVLHLDAPDIVPLTPMMRKLPVPFVIDHTGRVDSSLGTEQPAFKALLDLVRMPSCWVKVSGSERISKPPYEAALPFARTLVETAPDRVLWGTDFPHPNLAIPADEADLVDLLPRVATTAEAQRRLLVDNPARLYGFAENQASGTVS
jgi:predicted TIM-barrel fold metal-dependent hydrolase